MRVLIAPDSFKGTVDAADAAASLARGWRAVRPADEVRCLPLADGGEGTMAVLSSADAVRVPARVRDPIGRERDAHWLLLPDGTAVVELAVAAGLPLLAEPDPLGASTFGFGQLLRAATGHPGTKRVAAALGGSATTDGGSGALVALGAVFRDAGGDPLPPGGGALRDLAEVDLSGIAAPPVGGIFCLVDVATPLLGATGAAHRFAPQKGADPAAVAVLEAGLARFAEVLGGDPDAAGAGAAGGTAFGLATVWRAELVGGAKFVADLVGLADQLAWADLLITGEGRLDEQSWTGKVVGHAVAEAARTGTAVALAVGSCAVPPPAPCVSLTDLAGDGALARREPASWLAEAGRALAART